MGLVGVGGGRVARGGFVGPGQGGGDEHSQGDEDLTPVMMTIIIRIG